MLRFDHYCSRSRWRDIGNHGDASYGALHLSVRGLTSDHHPELSCFNAPKKPIYVHFPQQRVSEMDVMVRIVHLCMMGISRLESHVISKTFLDPSVSENQRALHDIRSYLISI